MCADAPQALAAEHGRACCHLCPDASPQAPPFAAASPPRGLAPQREEVWGAPECVQAQEAGAQGQGRAGTFLPGGVVRVEIPGHRDHLEHEVVPSLADHVHHLPVADLDNVLVVHLREDRGCGSGAAGAEGNSTHPWAAIALPPDRRTDGRSADSQREATVALESKP